MAKQASWRYMTRIVLVFFTFFVVSTASAGDHLLPISPGTGLLDQKVDKAWLKVIKEDDVAFVRFDIRPTFDATTHLAVLGHAEIGKEGPFRLCYMKGSYREETPICIPIGDDFAKALASKVEGIIRHDTHYSVMDNDVSPIDSTVYFFAANFVFAEVSGADKGSVPNQLIGAFKDCIKLAQMSSDDSNRQPLMDKILKDLDAIKASSS